MLKSFSSIKNNNFRKCLNAFNKSLADSCPLKKGDGVVLSVSGGADSILMLLLFIMIQKKTGIRLSAFHANHNLRKESGSDEDFVRSFCADTGIPCRVRRQKPGGRKTSLENSAREFRYKKLRELALLENCSFIATAHNRDDQAETVLMRLISGTGLNGLKGIPQLRSDQNIQVIRPMLALSRLQIRECLNGSNIRYCEDLSNSDNRFLRNRIRNQLIPIVEKEYNPQFRQHLISLARDAAEANQSPTFQAIPIRQFSFSVSQKDLLQMSIHQRNTWIKQLLCGITSDNQFISREHFSALNRLLNGNSGQSIRLNNGLKIVKRSKMLIFSRQD